MGSETLTTRLDRIGMTASTLCAIHCAVIPFVISVLPLWGLSFLAEEWMEVSMIGLTLTIGIWSLGLSWRKHRKVAAIAIFLSGFLFISLGHVFGHGRTEHLFLPLGGLIIALSHFINWRITKEMFKVQRSEKTVMLNK